MRQTAYKPHVRTDPFLYGWRDVWETAPDGSEKLRRIPLTYEDTLNPRLGDRLSLSTNHTDLTREIVGILKRRYEAKPSVAVWNDLKVRLPTGTTLRDDAPEGSKGPSPDVCVVGGVRDRARNRESFELGGEPGEIWLAIEVVSKNSVEKDHGGILEPYGELKVREYVAIRPRGAYLDGLVELRAWRRNAQTKKLEEVSLDEEGRFHARKTGLLFGTGPGGKGLLIHDAATEELLLSETEMLRAAEERAEQEARARKQEARARKREARARKAAEKRVVQEAQAREAAEAKVQELLDKIQGLESDD